MVWQKVHENTKRNEKKNTIHFAFVCLLFLDKWFSITEQTSEIERENKKNSENSNLNLNHVKFK